MTPADAAWAINELAATVWLAVLTGVVLVLARVIWPHWL